MKFWTFFVLSILLFSIIPTPVLASSLVDNDKDSYYSCEDDTCSKTLPFGANGLEKAECDQEFIDYESAPNLVAPGQKTEGKKVHPGSIEPPDSKIDYNCDGIISGWNENNKLDADYFISLMEKNENLPYWFRDLIKRLFSEQCGKDVYF